jgi:hypothetical protein
MKQPKMKKSGNFGAKVLHHRREQRCCGKEGIAESGYRTGNSDEHRRNQTHANRNYFPWFSDQGESLAAF